MGRIPISLILFSTFLLSASATAKPGEVQVRYIVDASHADKRLLTVEAQIEGLPEGRTTIVFPEFARSVANRISQIGRQSQDGHVSALALEDGRVVLESSGSEPLSLVFQLRGDSFEHLERATYLDESRCLFHPQDVLLQIENQDPKENVSFVLPAQWDIVSTTPPALDGTFSIETNRREPFYLGRAESVHDESTGPLSMAIEPGWPPAKELLASLRQQIRHRQKSVKNTKPRALLAVFFAHLRAAPSKEVLAFHTPQLLAFAAPSPALNETSIGIRKVQQRMAIGLARVYLPAVASFSPELGPNRLIDYLGLKACLKTGVLGRSEFLDLLAVDLWNAFGEPAVSTAKPRAGEANGRSGVPSPGRARCSGLLLDLALSFHGESTQSLDAFLAGLAPSTAGPITEADLRRRLRREEQASAALAGVWQHRGPQRIGELLRPFGLLFDRRELPAFDFQLNEAFQIAQLGRQHRGTTAMLEPGDRILAINNHRLILPDDLLKCRSRLMPGQEIHVDLERRNLPLRVTQRVAHEVLLKLEINKLADADKQQKLEQFLSVESEEN